MKKFLYILLSALGFSACGEAAIGDGTTKDGGDSQEIPVMYGTPTIEFTVRGKVTDSEGVHIEGIVGKHSLARLKLRKVRTCAVSKRRLLI